MDNSPCLFWVFNCGFCLLLSSLDLSPRKNFLICLFYPTAGEVIKCLCGHILGHESLLPPWTVGAIIFPNIQGTLLTNSKMRLCNSIGIVRLHSDKFDLHFLQILFINKLFKLLTLLSLILFFNNLHRLRLPPTYFQRSLRENGRNSGSKVSSITQNLRFFL